jgi:two-component sensor histidine kinase
VALSPSRALALGLLFHELATNAAKYGALAGGSGKVEVVWCVRNLSDGTRLEIDWTEHDGPKVIPPIRRGFGSRLIERSLQGQLGGDATLDYAPDGVRCHLRLPLAPD